MGLNRPQKRPESFRARNGRFYSEAGSWAAQSKRKPLKNFTWIAVQDLHTLVRRKSGMKKPCRR